MNKTIAAVVMSMTTLVVLTGCSSTPDTIDGADVARQIKEKASPEARAQIKSVECPDSPPMKTGTSFHCIVHAIDGSNLITTVNVEDDQGDLTWSTAS